MYEQHKKLEKEKERKLFVQSVFKDLNIDLSSKNFLANTAKIYVKAYKTFLLDKPLKIYPEYLLRNA